MDIFKNSIKIKTTTIILFILVLIIVALWFLYNFISDTKILTIAGGVIAGLIVAVIQLLIAWQDYKRTEKLRELELIEILYTRADRSFYEKYVRNSRKRIDLMGVTASRFFNDFADDSPDATQNAKVLLDALERGVKVRILLPSSNYVTDEQKPQVEKVKQRFMKLKERPNYSIIVKYFEHVAAHSVFIVDDKCIVGPVFPKVESKYTPALYLRNSSPIASKYIEYFESEWQNAK